MSTRTPKRKASTPAKSTEETAVPASRTRARTRAPSSCAPIPAATIPAATTIRSPRARTRKAETPTAQAPVTSLVAPPIARTSKQAQLIAQLSIAPGMTLAQMMTLTGWQAHSVRGVLSGVLRKKLGLQVVCERATPSGERRYRIDSPQSGV